MNKCRVELVYDAMGLPYPIGCTFDQRILVLVKRQVLKEAEQDYERAKDNDEVLRIDQLGNLKRLRDTLDLLIPPETEEIALSGNGKGNGREQGK
jgi:hypothetical protein